MAKFINSVHSLVDLLTGKNQTGYHSPEEIDLAIYNASKAVFNEEYEKYSESSRISDDLAPFLVEEVSMPGAVSGMSPKPSDYLYFVALRAGAASGTNQCDVHIVDEAMWGNRINSPIVPPTVNYPVARIGKTNIDFRPSTGLANVKLTYFKAPVTPVWAYDIVNSRAVYNDSNSVDIEWSPVRQTRITMLALSYLGINLRESDMVQFAELQKKQL